MISRILTSVHVYTKITTKNEYAGMWDLETRTIVQPKDIVRNERKRGV